MDETKHKGDSQQIFPADLFSEDELLPISALQHLLFCERQCALIHIEQAWSENRFTAEGRLLHERADSGEWETRGQVRTERTVPLRSLRLGLSGQADVVEFHKISNSTGWQPFPVEYKRGSPKAADWDKVQLCAQALCLEEMLGRSVPAGAIYYGKNRRRQAVDFDQKLRQQTETAAARLHQLLASRVTPPAHYEKKCESCSLLDQCLPKVVGRGKDVKQYLESMLATFG